VTLNIVCFGVTDDADGAIAREIVMDLHEGGEAAPSLTLLDGVPAIRAAILNHRTEAADIDRFMALLDAALERARRAPHAAAIETAPRGPGRTPLPQD
jgi:aromatic-L-amino-acid/L-tryptophan decarboxylase